MSNKFIIKTIISDRQKCLIKEMERKGYEPISVNYDDANDNISILFKKVK